MSLIPWSTVILIQREPHDLGYKIFENKLWLAIQVLQANLASPCAGFCRDRGCQERKAKQPHRSHKMVFGWWLQPDCTMPSRLSPEFLCLPLYPNRPKTYQAWTHTHTSSMKLSLVQRAGTAKFPSTESPAAPSQGRLLVTQGASPSQGRGQFSYLKLHPVLSSCFPVTFLSPAKNWHHWPVYLLLDM